MTNEHFNFIAGYYDRAARFSLNEQFLEKLNLPKDAIFLDAGGGTGRVGDALRHCCRLTIVADVAFKMLEFAKEKELECLLAPVENLPIKSNTIDRIVMMDAFHHLQDQAAAAKDLLRVLKPGGRILLIEPNIEHFRVKLIALAEKLLFMRSRMMTGGKIAACFRDTGTVVDVKLVNFNIWIIIDKC